MKNKNRPDDSSSSQGSGLLSDPVSRRAFLQRLTALFMLSSAGGGLLAGCGGGGGGSASASPGGGSGPGGSGGGAGPLTVKPHVVILPSDGSVAASSISATSIVLTGKVPPLAAGAVVVLPTGAGLLRKVVSSSVSGSTVTVQTAQATLADVFSGGTLQWSEPLLPAQIANTSASPGALAALRPGVPRAGALATTPLFEVDVSKAVLPGSLGSSLSLSGVTGVYITPSFTIQFGFLDIESIEFTVDLTLDMNLTASMLQGFSFTNSDLMDFTINLDAITIPTVVPVVLIPQVTLNVSASGSLEAGVSGGVTDSLSYTVGCGWNPQQGGYPIGKPSQTLTATVDSPFVAASLDFSFTPGVDLLLYDVVGPNLAGQVPALSFAAVLETAPPSLALSASATFAASAGIKFEIIGYHQDFDVTVAAVTVPLYSKTIAAPALPIVTGTLIDAATGQPLSGYTVSVQGTSLTATTDANGNFSIANVPAGPATLVFKDSSGNVYGSLSIANVTAPTYSVGQVKLEGTPPNPAPVVRRRR